MHTKRREKKKIREEGYYEANKEATKRGRRKASMRAK